MKLNKEKIYEKLPVFLQNYLVSYAGKKIMKRRYDTGFSDKFKEVMNRDLTSHKIYDFQKERVRAHLKYSMNSPYWARKIKQYNVNIEADNIIQELEKLPILTKEEVKENKNEISISEEDQNLIDIQTSGSTGASLKFEQTKEFEHEQWAVWWRYRQSLGIKFNELCGYFGGKIIVPIRNHQGPYWRFNKPGNQIMFSTYHIKSSTCEEYVKVINKKEIRWLHGYPSALALLAGYIVEQNLSVTSKIKFITIGSEGLQNFQKELIEKAFGAQVYQHYGLAEGVANISECHLGKLHVDEDFSYTEFVPLDNSNTYKLIGTNFANKAFPLFRYDTNDVVTINPEDVCECENKGRIVEEIDGRRDDYVILPNERRIGRLSHIFKANTYIKEAQIVQNNNKEILIKVVRMQEYEEFKEEEVLIKQARKWLGEEIKINIEYVNEIKKTKNGKLRLVVSEIT